MIIIADAGATKTDWCSISDEGTIRRFRSKGLNPSVQSVDQMREIVGESVPELNPSGQSVGSVHFYGAGFISEEVAAPMVAVLDLWCPLAQIGCHSDLLGAARALWGDGDGVVAIMGTGSNSCLYKNGTIVNNIRPGGYVIGDEGSGAMLGKMLLADYIKGLMPPDIEEQFRSKYNLDYSKIVSKVYYEPRPSAFLAAISLFVVNNLEHEYIRGLVEECVESFVRRALSRYDCKNVGVVGSFGYTCREILEEVGARYGLKFTRFLPAPLDALIEYHHGL